MNDEILVGIKTKAGGGGGLGEERGQVNWFIFVGAGDKNRACNFEGWNVSSLEAYEKNQIKQTQMLIHKGHITAWWHIR